MILTNSTSLLTLQTSERKGQYVSASASTFCNMYSFIHSFIHSGYLYSASSSPVLFRGAPDTALILCRSFTLKRHRQLRVKDLPKAPTWRLERDSNPQPSGRKVSNLPMSHHEPHLYFISVSLTFL